MFLISDAGHIERKPAGLSGAWLEVKRSKSVSCKRALVICNEKQNPKDNGCMN